MSTINISLPSEQVNFVDKLVASHGFANRSEFIRSLLRLISRNPQLIASAATYPFTQPQEKSVKKIVNEFEKTGKYSSAFLKDLKEGLKNSDYFEK